MEYASWVAGYLALSLLCFYAFYMNVVDFGFRLDHSKIDDSSLWRYALTEQIEILKLLRYDFFRLHCPWSKKTSIKYRVEEAHSLLQHMHHEKGWKAEDCHNPAKHAQIAHDCFQYRSTFWASQIFNILTAPIRLVLLIVIAVVVVLIMMVYDGATKSFKFVFSKT